MDVKFGLKVKMLLVVREEMLIMLWFRVGVWIGSFRLFWFFILRMVFFLVMGIFFW